MATLSIKQTPTTESLVELENEKRPVYRTRRGKTVVHVPRTSRHHVQREGGTARKIICPTESDEMNVKRIVRYLKGALSAKCLIEIVTPPTFVNVHTDSDWAGQPTTCKSTCGGVVQWENEILTSCEVVKRNSHRMVTDTANNEPEFCWGRIICSDNWDLPKGW